MLAELLELLLEGLEYELLLLELGELLEELDGLEELTLLELLLGLVVLLPVEVFVVGLAVLLLLLFLGVVLASALLE